MILDEFGHGVIILLLKNADGDKTTYSNYRGITLSPVISEIFELVLIALFEDHLQSNPLQFGFKHCSSTRHALFSLKTATEHYVKGGSNAL